MYRRFLLELALLHQFSKSWKELAFSDDILLTTEDDKEHIKNFFLVVAMVLFLLKKRQWIILLAIPFKTYNTSYR